MEWLQFAFYHLQRRKKIISIWNEKICHACQWFKKKKIQDYNEAYNETADAA